MSAAPIEPTPYNSCPACHRIIVRPAREPGRLLLKNRFLVLDPDGSAVIGCPHCPAVLEVQRGRMLGFRTRNFDASSQRVVPRRC